MGYFALVADHAKIPTLEECHINVWRLPGLLVRRSIYVDVGLALSSKTADNIDSFCLALPFSVDDEPIDLAVKLRDSTIAHLIFGRAVKIDEDVLTYRKRGGEEVTRGVVSTSSVELERRKSSKDLSVWRISLARPLPVGQTQYLRLRFRVARFSKGWLDVGNDELADLRVADTREAQSIDSWQAFEHLIVPARALYVFIIAPASMQALTASPNFEVRLLEGVIWKRYFSRTGLDTARLAIYRFKTDKAVDASSPFRVYLKLGHRHGFPGPFYWGMVLIATTAACFLGSSIGTTVISTLWAALVEYWGRLGGAAGFVGFLWALREYSAHLGKLGYWLRKLDRGIRESAQ